MSVRSRRTASAPMSGVVVCNEADGHVNDPDKSGICRDGDRPVDVTFDQKPGAEKISRRKLSDQVLDRLRDMIRRGELKAGDVMPSERALMERFGVGRPAVREALQSLHDTFEHLDPAEDWPTWYLIASSRAPARHRVRDRDLPRRRGTRSGFWRSRERRASPPSRPFAFGVGAGDGSRS